MKSCKNCDAALSGAYCHDCGQKDMDLKRPFLSLLREALHESFDIDGRAARTIGTLLTRPGTLTTRFLDGHRQEYTPPVRLYLIVSLLFFLIVAWVVRQGYLFPVDANTSGEVRVLTEQLPQMMFIFLPAFALLLKILHRHRYYFDHLIHAVHLHTAAYVALALLLPIERNAGENLLLLLLQLSVFAYLAGYLLISQQRVYSTSWLAASLKTLLLFFSYASLLAISIETASQT